MNIGLALSGGGLRGAAHIGFLQVLCSNKIKADMVCGTSAGSIVAGMYALGMSPSKMQSAIKPFSLLSFRDLNAYGFFKYLFKAVFATFTLYKVDGPLGLIRGKVLEKQLKNLFGNTLLQNLKTPYAAVATDIHSGEMVVFTSLKVPNKLPDNCVVYNSAYLHEAVRASISIPGIFEPFYFDGRYLVDGALKANVPSNICRLFGVEKTIAVDLGFQVHEEHHLRSIFEVLMQATDIMGQEISDLVNEYYTDVIVRPQLPTNVGLTDFSTITACIASGQKATLSSMPSIMALINKKTLK